MSSVQSADVAYRRAVGKRIRVWRVLNERSQDELAADAGVTRNFVSAIERGAQGLDAVRLRRLALAMDMTLGDLLADPEPVVWPFHADPDPAAQPGRTGLGSRT
jgi:transcriptional regulator with XRE-family HTH domain